MNDKDPGKGPFVGLPGAAPCDGAMVDGTMSDMVNRNLLQELDAVEEGRQLEATVNKTFPSSPPASDVRADALEDAGCVEEAVLAHLRDPGPHARRCWVLDLILGAPDNHPDRSGR